MGCVRGEGSADVVLEFMASSMLLVSSGELATLWASRRPLGWVGACWLTLGDRIEGSRDELPGMEGGEEGRRGGIFEQVIISCDDS